MEPIALRCAWCHDDAPAGAPRCGGCGTIVHAECLSALDSCTTIGCREKPRPPRANRALNTLVTIAFDSAIILAITALACVCLYAMTKEIVGSF
jgi:hypothetical protein